MKTILRTAYCTYKEVYELKLTPELVTEYNKYFHERTENKYVGEIEITADMLVKALDFDFNYEENIAVVIYDYQNREMHYKLYNWLRDILNDDLWDSDYKSEYIETNDWEDTVVESEN